MTRILDGGFGAKISGSVSLPSSFAPLMFFKLLVEFFFSFIISLSEIYVSIMVNLRIQLPGDLKMIHTKC